MSDESKRTPNPMADDQVCGTCKWWHPSRIQERKGWCRWRTDHVLPDSFTIKSTDYGQGRECPCWMKAEAAPRETHQERAERVLNESLQPGSQITIASPDHKTEKTYRVGGDGTLRQSPDEEDQ